MVDEGRATQRSRLLLAAQLLVSGEPAMEVTIRNLSASGALLETPRNLSKDVEVELVRGDLSAIGVVAWAKPGKCGIHFVFPINLVAWLPNQVLSDGQQRVDDIQASIRAGHTPMPAADDLPTRLQPMLASRIAEELGYASRMLDALGDELATDQLAARHGAKLQNLDIVTQMLGHLASVLRAEDPNIAIKQIGIEELRRRLLRKDL